MATTKQRSASYKRISSRGFTLIEVLVALVIITIALSALISTSGSQASSATYLKQKSIAHWVAMNEITQLQVQKAWLEKGSKDGSATMAGTEWYWTVSVKETEDKDSRQVEFRIFTDKDREDNVTRLTGYLSRPKAALDVAQP